jgi:uncharacterized protein YbaR (Trm112 family)
MMATEIVRAWLADPLDGWDPNVELPPQATRDEAELRAATIRSGLERFVRDVVPAMLQAYLSRDWVALEYASWREYVRERWGVDQLRLSTEDRQTVARLFRLYGASNRSIGSALNVGEATVRRDLAGAPDDAPAQVLGADGKRYPARGHTAETGTWYCQSCGNEWPVVDGEPNTCPECGGRGGFEPRPAEPQETDAGYIANPDERLAAVAELAPEYVREVEWPTGATASGAVESQTPAGPTDEAPADEPAEVTYRGWRKFATASLAKARKDLALVTGDYLEAGTVAERADEATIVEMEQLAENLAEFCRKVRELRPPSALVWMSTTRRGLDYHRPGATAVESRMNVGSTVCGRSMRTGRRLELQQAIGFYQAKPCTRCWPNGDGVSGS